MMTASTPSQVLLRELLTPVARPIRLVADDIYRSLGVKWYAKGLFIKEAKKGREVKAARLFLVQVGDFIYNRLFAWKGSFALAGPEHAGCVVSGEFPAFRVNAERLLPAYLMAFFSSPWLWEMIAGQSSGTAEVSRLRLKEAEFLRLAIPLPSLAEQERIVKLLDDADELRKLRAEADRRTAALLLALFHQMFGDPQTNPKRWPIKRLGEATMINPSLQKEKQPIPETEVSFVPMAAVDEVLGVIPSSETRRYSEVARGYTPFQNGDVLFAKITPCMQNGKSAVADNLVGGLGFGSTEFYVLRPTDIVTSEYVFWLIRRPSFRAQAEQTFTGTVGQQRVPTSFLENYPCPVPPLALQKEFGLRVTEIRALEAEQTASRLRLDALFQSVLHRAFNGEL